MNTSALHLAKPPIVEAVVDFDCDHSPGQELLSLEAEARSVFRDTYPKFRRRYAQEFKIEARGDDPPDTSSRYGLEAFQFLKRENEQLVQVRDKGFSFNRLTPYEGFDRYLPEIERTWQLYLNLAVPTKVSVLRLRYINRIEVPAEGGRVGLDAYFKAGTQLPSVAGARFTGFLSQYSAMEPETGNRAKIFMTAQDIVDDKLPVILDIRVSREISTEPGNWDVVLPTLLSLRMLKNRIFTDMITEQCQALYR